MTSIDYDSDQITLSDHEEGDAYYDNIDDTDAEILRVQARLKELGIKMVSPDQKKEIAREKAKSKASKHWRETFDIVKKASLLEIAAGAEECSWYVVYTNKDEYGAANFTRTNIIKAKNNFMQPGVWRLRARTFIKDDVFDLCEVQAQFVCENKELPTEITIIQQKRKDNLATVS